MPPATTTRTGRRAFNGFEINIYGFLPDHIIQRDQETAPTGIGDMWDPADSRLEEMGPAGDTSYTLVTEDPPNANTVVVFSGPQALADDGNGILTGDGTGTVDYVTGRVVVTLNATAAYPVFVSYLTGDKGNFVSLWDDPQGFWDRMSRLPVIQKTYWSIELEANSLIDKVEEFDTLRFPDTIKQENLPFGFQSYGFASEIVDIDLATSRALLRDLRTLWQTKAGLRSWFALLRTLDYEVEIFPLWKTNLENNYGDDPGEFYSRVRRTLVDAIGPIIIGSGNDTDVVNFQFPVTTDTPDWATMVLELDDFPAGFPTVDSEVLTVNPNTGEITGSLLAEGQVDLAGGSGFIDFKRLIRSSQFLRATYTTILSPFQAARVDLEYEMDPDVPHKAGDRAVGAILGAIEVVRPIHVLIRALNVTIPENEIASINEGSECGPNQADLKTYTYPDLIKSGISVGVSGSTVYNGFLAPGHVIPGTVTFTDLGGGQQVSDDGHGGLVGDGSGFLDYRTGYFVVTFGTATTSNPTVSFRHFVVTPTAAEPQIERWMADLVDLTNNEGNLVEFVVTEVGQPDDARYSFEDEAKIEGDFLEITVNDPPGPDTVLTF